MEMSKELKHQIFKTIEGLISLHEFELWLYKQEALVNDMDNEFNFVLLSFAYKKSGAKYEFVKEVFLFLDKEEFNLWKVKSNLLTLISSKRTAYWDKIFDDFNDLAYHGCHELYAIGSYCDYLDIEIYDFITIEEIEQELRMKAIELLLWINLEEMKVSSFKLSEFPYSSDNRLNIKKNENLEKETINKEKAYFKFNDVYDESISIISANKEGLELFANELLTIAQKISSGKLKAGNQVQINLEDNDWIASDSEISVKIQDEPIITGKPTAKNSNEFEVFSCLSILGVMLLVFGTGVFTIVKWMFF
jgi:hypothetical protein